MKKLWAVLFLAVPIGCMWLFFAAPSLGWWLPKDVSTHGHEIDHLFHVIFWITGVVFVLTELALAYFLFRYSGEEGKKGVFIHGNHKAEVIWSVIPAVILAFIAFYQFSAWKRTKFTDRFPTENVMKVEVLAGQFEWRMRYPGQDGKLQTRDDVISVNDFHVPVNKNVIVHLNSRDVLHSFFLPNLRVKQDAVPGTTIPLWFQATETGLFDLACAELCGWGHYKMKGRLTVQTQAEFDGWLKKTYEEQEKSQ